MLNIVFKYRDRRTKGIVEPIQLTFFEEYGPGADYPLSRMSRRV